MPDITVSTPIDTFMQSADQAAMRTNLALGDAATKNTGTTAGTVAAGDDSRITGALQTSGGTMTGKLTAAASDTEAKLNVGSRLTTGAPSTIAAGDVWVSNQGALTYRDSSGPTSRALAATTLPNTFNQPQTIGSTANAGAVLSVSNSGTREVVTISNTATATSDAVVITNLGSGNSLVVNDETTPDSTRFAVANNGRVGIGVAPDASVALAVDSTGIKFSDNSVQITAGLTGTVQEANGGTGETSYTNGQLLIGNSAGGLTKATLTAGTNVTITNGDGAITINAAGGGGGGTVTSITAGTGLTGGTITTSGTVAADFGTTAGKVTEGGTTVLKAGDTMTGKLNLGNVASTAPVNLGANVNPTPVVNGDVWLNTSNQLTWRGNNGATYPAASTVAINSFTAAQGISASTTGSVLGVTQTTGTGTAISVTQNATGTGSGITVDLNNTSSTATAVRITNQGTGASLVVEDQASVDPTPFTVSNSGRVGVGVTPDASVALSVDTTGIKFGDGTIQTTASGGGVAGVSSFSAGTTGLTPSTGTTGAVTLGGTLGVANGGTGATTLTGIVKGSGTSALSAAVAGTDYVVPSGSITGTASNVTGTVAIANGGTGQTTANSALNALLPSQASNSGKVLSTDGTNTSWITAGGGSGTVTSVDVSGGTTGLTTSGGPVTGSGTITLAGTLTESNGGTGETTYTNGQLLIGNSSGGLTKATLTAGSNVTITNGDGAITIASTGGGGGGSTTQVDVYTTSQTITIPAGAKMLYAWACGGGAGGGSGSFGDGVNASGGGGGAGGSINSAWVSVANLTALGWSSLSVVVGAGGNGGAAITTASSTVNGNNGSAGAVSGLTKLGFSVTGSDPGLVATVNAPTAGSKPSGVSTGGNGGNTASVSNFTIGAATSGGAGGNPGSNGTSGTGQASGTFGSTGGGGGGSFLAAGATVTSGGGGGNAYFNGVQRASDNGVNNVRVAAGFSSGIYFQASCGGGGGSGGNQDGYQDGGDGGFPGGGGGGGGGAGINPTSGTSTATRSGKGGKGGNGLVILTWYF